MKACARRERVGARRVASNVSLKNQKCPPTCCAIRVSHCASAPVTARRAWPRRRGPRVCNTSRSRHCRASGSGRIRDVTAVSDQHLDDDELCCIKCFRPSYDRPAVRPSRDRMSYGLGYGMWQWRCIWAVARAGPPRPREVACSARALSRLLGARELGWPARRECCWPAWLLLKPATDCLPTPRLQCCRCCRGRGGGPGRRAQSCSSARCGGRCP